ncbi:LOW QUALITY PROTEIN: leukocyte immunoglobulin-like receptor subfamily A member 6 [Dugong dugon]
MSPTPTSLLGLGHLPRPSISAKPGSVIPRGTSVTFVCRGPPEAETFRLEKDGMNPYPDVKSSPGAETEAIFLIDSVKTDTAGCYSCIYNTGNIYSERSEVLELVVTGGPSDISPSPTEAGFQTAPTFQNYTVENCVCLGLAGVVLSMLLGSVHHQLQDRAGFGGYAMSPTPTTFLGLGGPSDISPSPTEAGFQTAPTFQNYKVGNCVHLSLAGTLPKPFIWADPGTIITIGRPVTICQGSLQAETYHLYEEQVSQPLGMWVAWNFRDKARFSIKSMSPNSAGKFQCIYNSSSGWSERSDYLQLVVTRMYSKPSFSAHPNPLVASGGNVSLLCNSKDTMDTFHLLKEGGTGPPQHRESRFSAGRHQAVFPVDSVNISDGGTYRCYGSFRFSSHVWSHPSDHVDLKVTGTFEKPLLSAHPGPSVTLGENVTLQCRSERWCDTFHLFKEDFIAPPQRLHWQNNTGPFQVNFTTSLVNSVHAGTYRCYSSHSTSPYLLSQPSDPLELIVSGDE